MGLEVRATLARRQIGIALLVAACAVASPGAARANGLEVAASATRLFCRTSTSQIETLSRAIQQAHDPVFRARVRRAFTGPQIASWNLDWDDNVFFMPTEVLLLHGPTGEERGFTTNEFAKIRPLVGAPGEWEDFEIVPDLATGSIRMFGDEAFPERNLFLEDILRRMKSGQPWQGPSWAAFVVATSTRATARQTTIITARAHAPATMHAGLVRMKQMGLIAHVPPEENIFPVNYPAMAAELGSTAADPSGAKFEVMARRLDALQARPFGRGAIPIVDQVGTDRTVLHQWSFSDDDLGTFNRAVQELSEGVSNGRWPDVKVIVFYTGPEVPPDVSPAVVLRPDGTTRAPEADELAEVICVLGRGCMGRAAAAWMP